MEFTAESLSEVLKNELDKQTATLKEELENVKKEINTLRANTQRRLKECEDRIFRIEKEVLRFKRKAVKNNIIVTGLRVDYSNLLHSAIFLLNLLLGVRLREQDINNIYRLGRDKPEVKIEFFSHVIKKKVVVNQYKLRGYGIYIADDLIEEDRFR